MGWGGVWCPRPAGRQARAAAPEAPVRPVAGGGRLAGSVAPSGSSSGTEAMAARCLRISLTTLTAISLAACSGNRRSYSLGWTLSTGMNMVPNSTRILMRPAATSSRRPSTSILLRSLTVYCSPSVGRVMVAKALVYSSLYSSSSSDIGGGSFGSTAGGGSATGSSGDGSSTGSSTGSRAGAGSS